MFSAREKRFLTELEKLKHSIETELGFRPIFHHKKERTEAHLFIGVLAYHLLVSIETTLRTAGYNRECRIFAACRPRYSKSELTIISF